MARKRMELKDAEDAYNFFESRKAKTGETFLKLLISSLFNIKCDQKSL